MKNECVLNVTLEAHLSPVSVSKIRELRTRLCDFFGKISEIAFEFWVRIFLRIVGLLFVDLRGTTTVREAMTR